MSVRACSLTDEHGPHDWWEDAEQIWVCTGTMPDDWSGLIDLPDRFVVSMDLSIPARVGESIESIESYLRGALEGVGDITITALSVTKREGRW